MEIGVLVAVAAFGVIAYLWRKRSRERRREKLWMQVDELADAAAAGSEDDLQRLAATTEVNTQNPDGDSALHIAYYDGRTEAVARLKALGADETLRNNEGLTPVEMTALAETEELLDATLACMSGNVWTNETRGRTLYDKLRQCPPRIYTPALIRVFLLERQLDRLICLAVKVGKRGSEQRLALMLDAYGSKEMAILFLNSGSGALSEAGRAWAHKHGYRVYYMGDRGGVTRWGRF